MTEAFLKRKSTFFSLPEWQAASQKGDSYDELLDLLFQIPTILQLCDKIVSVETVSKEILPALGDLLDRSDRTDQGLSEWYGRLQQQTEPEPLYVVDSAPLSINRPLLSSEEDDDDDPQLLGLVSGTVLFSNEYLFEVVMLYWFGCLMLYTSLARVHKKLKFLDLEGLIMQQQQQQQDDDDGDFLTTGMMSSSMDATTSTILSFLSRRDIECTASQLARQVCQTVAFCLQPTAGAQGFQFMLATLWAAQEYFRLRSAPHYSWCQQVFGVMAKRGYGAGKAAANITYQQYVDMIDNNWGLGSSW
jgi:hypothetical protein